MHPTRHHTGVNHFVSHHNSILAVAQASPVWEALHGAFPDKPQRADANLIAAGAAWWANHPAEDGAPERLPALPAVPGAPGDAPAPSAEVVKPRPSVAEPSLPLVRQLASEGAATT